MGRPGNGETLGGSKTGERPDTEIHGSSWEVVDPRELGQQAKPHTAEGARSREQTCSLAKQVKALSHTMKYSQSFCKQKVVNTNKIHRHVMLNLVKQR